MLDTGNSSVIPVEEEVRSIIRALTSETPYDYRKLELLEDLVYTIENRWSDQAVLKTKQMLEKKIEEVRSAPLFVFIKHCSDEDDSSTDTDLEIMTVGQFCRENDIIDYDEWTDEKGEIPAVIDIPSRQGAIAYCQTLVERNEATPEKQSELLAKLERFNGV